MKTIGRLLESRAGDSAERVSAAVVATYNEIIQQKLGLGADDCLAVFLRHDTVTVRVKHGAVAAMVKNQEPEIIAHANAVIKRRWPRAGELVKRLATRMG